jgi:flavodoxin
MKGADASMSAKTLIVLVSYHHRNTEKVAQAISGVLGARIKGPQETSPDEINEYDLIGFGSGIYDARHHMTLLNLADGLPPVRNRKAFLFSTYGAPPFIANERFVLSNHVALRNKLLAKGFEVIGDYGCAGYNTNSFLRRIGGLNKGRPNAEDIRRAEDFAEYILSAIL